MDTATYLFGIVNFPHSDWNRSPRNTSLSTTQTIPPWTILTPYTIFPRITSTIVKWERAISIGILTEGLYTITFACVEIVHSIAASL